MGGDGGVIAVQREFMRGTYTSSHKNKAWAGGQNFGAGMTGGDAEGGVDPRRVRAVRVRTCALSAEPLSAPIVADELGNLFTKYAVLSALSERTIPERLAHIRGLRDLVDCRLVEPEQATYHTGEAAAITACPITGEALDGSKQFVVIRTTGAVVSEAALLGLGQAAQAEFGPYVDDDVIKIAPSDDDAAVLRDRMQARRDRDKAKRKRRHKDDATKDNSRGDPPPKRAPVSQAARIAKAAAQQAEADRQKHPTLNDVLHDDKSQAPPDAAKLFIATAPKRYYLN